MKDFDPSNKNAGICIPTYINICRKAFYEPVIISPLRGESKRMHSCAELNNKHNSCKSYKPIEVIC